MITHSHNLTKNERLCSKKLINELFINGKSFIIKPYKITWLTIPSSAQNSELETQNSKLLISVSSNKIKKAVDRNKIKRRIREAFRKNKSAYYDFLKQKNKQAVFAIIFNAYELMPYSEIEIKIILILQRLISLIDNE
jgi:ribonuclease P protein component